MVYKDTTREAERQQALGDYSSSIEMQSIGVSLKENGKTVSWRDKYNSSTGEWSENEGKLLTGMVGERREVSARENISRRNSSM